jgi:hypothetical protein
VKQIESECDFFATPRGDSTDRFAKTQARGLVGVLAVLVPRGSDILLRIASPKKHSPAEAGPRTNEGALKGKGTKDLIAFFALRRASGPR